MSPWGQGVKYLILIYFEKLAARVVALWDETHADYAGCAVGALLGDA